MVDWKKEDEPYSNSSLTKGDLKLSLLFGFRTYKASYAGSRGVGVVMVVGD